jgi:membrane fusion protein, multidrug efflux system
MKTQLITGGVLVVMVTLTACAGKTDSSVQTISVTPVHVTQPTPGPAAPPLVTSGIVTTADEIKLSFKTGGVIERIRVREGERIAAGQILAELMPAEINASLTQVQQMSDKAQRDLERGQRLYNDQVIPLEQFQNLQTQAKVAAVQLDAARFNQQWVRITAPSAGVVLRKLADEHEAVASGQPVLVLGAAQRGYIVKAALADREIVQLKRGDTVTVTVDAMPNSVLKGTVTVIGGAASMDNGLFPVEVTLEQSDAALVTGMVAHLSFQPTKSKDTLLYIPTGAVVSGINNQADVFVLTGEVAKKRSVQVAFFTRDHVALQSGLTGNEQVITDGALYLSDGERVGVQKD